MKNYYEGLKLACSFFTILPVKSEYSENNLFYSIFTYPFIGLLLGIVVFIFGKIFQLLFFEFIILSSIVLVIVEYSFSNFLHVDGFCDTIDALYFTKKSNDKYTILKDPHIGTYAVCWLIILIALKISAYYMCIKENYWTLLFAFSVFSYFAVPAQVFFLEPFNKDGLGYSLKTIVMKKHIYTNFIISFFIVLFFAGFKITFFTSILICLIMMILNKLINYKFEGYNGDTLGFSIEICKVVLFWFLIIL